MTWPSAVGILLVFIVVFALDTLSFRWRRLSARHRFRSLGFCLYPQHTAMVHFGFLFIPLSSS